MDQMTPEERLRFRDQMARRQEAMMAADQLSITEEDIKDALPNSSGLEVDQIKVAIQGLVANGTLPADRKVLLSFLNGSLGR